MSLPVSRNITLIDGVSQIPAATMNDLQDYVIGIAQQLIGNGADGAAILDGTNTVSWATKSGSTYTMTRDCFCSSLTVTGAGVVLKTAGFRIRCRGTLTTVGGAIIQNDGANGSGTTLGAGAPSGALLGGGNGGIGGGTGLAGTGGVAATGFGGAGGHGGDGGGAGVGASGGTLTTPAASLGNPNAFNPGMLGFLQGLSGTTPTITAIGGGSGGGGGGGGGSTAGGGGGGGGGVMVVIAQDIVLANASDIHCNGGNGVSGTSGSGGGGGGGGGVMFVAYVRKNVTLTAAVNCAAGATGTGGTSSTAATAGNLYQFSLAGL